jgi:N-acetylneuraminate lyase
MREAKMRGIFTALMVSFDKEGNLNEKGLREIIRYNLDICQVDGLYVNGSTGENFMLSTEEKKEIFRITKEEVNDECKLIAQVGSINLKEAIELAQYATNLGYDAISAVTPFYYKFDFDEIKHYYTSIINSIDNKMIVYSIPFLTGVNMSLEQFAELFENEKIIGVKFTAADFYLLERMRKAFPDKLIYAGFDEMLLPATVLGVDGAIGSTFNINGQRAKQIFELAKQGEVERARGLQHLTNDLITDVIHNGLYQTIKEILKTKGVDAGYCRQPMKILSDEKVRMAKEISEKYLVQ